jgi:restriction endonuclease Mrr
MQKYDEAEKYYLAGLSIKPDHNGINEYLGELYVKTNRIDLAKERLEVLRKCNCEEFEELKVIIDKL